MRNILIQLSHYLSAGFVRSFAAGTFEGNAGSFSMFVSNFDGAFVSTLVSAFDSDTFVLVYPICTALHITITCNYIGWVKNAGNIIKFYV